MEAAALATGFPIMGVGLFEGAIEVMKDYSIRAPFFYTKIELSGSVVVPLAVFSWVYGGRVYSRWLLRKKESKREHAKRIFCRVLAREEASRE